MKANELMIGDWVKMPNDEGVLTPMKIESFYFDTLVANGCEHFEEDCSPIRLTAEILERNGWNDWCEHSTIVRSVSVLIEDNANLCIQEIKGQDSMFVQISHCGAGTFKFIKHLKYVHELQHALRLCGIDKEIVL